MQFHEFVFAAHMALRAMTDAERAEAAALMRERIAFRAMVRDVVARARR